MCSSIRSVFSLGRSGQASVEAAFLIPVIFLGLLLLLQPGILLYDRVVMQAAAVDGCRMLVTCSDAQGLPDPVLKERVIRHLGAIPSQDCFHCHSGGCSWKVSLQGQENASEVKVVIAQQVKPLPLLDVSCSLIGLLNDQGNFDLSVEQRMPTQPEWVAGSEYGSDPGAWVGQWDV